MIKKTFKKIPPDLVLDAQLKLDEVSKMLNPFLTSLTPVERRGMVKTGAGSIEFLELSHGFAAEYPELFPGFMKAGVFEEEFFAVISLRALSARVNRLRDRLKDTEMVTCCHALDTALAFYNTIKIAARRDIPGAGLIYEELKQRCPPKSRRQCRIDASQAD